jgi:hypothetical protein
LGDVDAAVGAFDGFLGGGLGDVVGVILGFGFQGQEPDELGVELHTVGTGVAQEGQGFVVVLAGGALSGADAGDGVGGVDGGMDGEAGGGDAPARLQFLLGGCEVFRCFGGIGAGLGAADGAGPLRSRPCAARSVRGWSGRG